LSDFVLYIEITHEHVWNETALVLVQQAQLQYTLCLWVLKLLQISHIIAIPTSVNNKDIWPSSKDHMTALAYNGIVRFTLHSYKQRSFILSFCLRNDL